MELTGHREPPQAEAVEQLVARSRPDLETLFRRHWVSDGEAGELFDDVLSCLVVRWSRLDDPAPWLLRTMERAIACSLLLPLFGEERPETSDLDDPDLPVALFPPED